MVRGYLYLLLFIPYTALSALSFLLCSPFDRNGRIFAFHIRQWARGCLFLAGVRATLSGDERLPPGPVIFMSNHQSSFDIPALLAMLPRDTRWIAKEELFRIPLFGTAMKRGGFIPLNRKEGRQALQNIELARKVLAAGRSIVIFPEGTRSRDFRLLPFKRGGFLLASRAGAPIIPVTINGSGKVNPAGTLEVHGGHISVTLHPPVIPEHTAGRSRATDEAMKRVAQAIESNLEV